MIIFRALKSNLLMQLFGQNKLPLYKELGLLGHNGWDWACFDGEPIYWDTDGRGKVMVNGIDSKGGWGVEIRSEDKGKYYKHRFWHLKEFKCQVGQIVETGDLIGLGDSTGYSTGSHLHRDLKECDQDFNTLNKNNGFFGCIDIQPFFKSVFVKDYVSQLKAQISLIERIIEAYQKLISLFKSKKG